ncbi:hypothetical protein F5Y04DRAFT_240821 [Hypomontagnella monticulosa]|nr:hypothetical protein F5Y04DRAFT_240821 [Hypomontagnella monticulosa]
MSAVQPNPQGAIKVYTTPGVAARWMNPEHLHLHETMESGGTVCCRYTLAGGIIEDERRRLFFLTHDGFEPEEKHYRSRHVDTDDKSCLCIGQIEHTNWRQYFCLISINDSVVIRECIQHVMPRTAAVPLCRLPLSAMLRPTRQNKGIDVVARTIDNKLVEGCITSAPSESGQSRGGLMGATFATSYGSYAIEAGMWVYALRHGAAYPEPTEMGKLNGSRRGPYPPEVFSYRNYDITGNNPFTLVGYIVEVLRTEGPIGLAEVTVQSMYGVQREMIRNGE